jgi:hypothetical protein
VVGPDDDFLACVGRAEANFLDCWTWVQSRACAFLLWYFKGGLVDLGCLGDHDHFCSFDR